MKTTFADRNPPAVGAPAAAPNGLMANEASRLRMTQLALENIGESIYWLGLDGSILFVNRAAERELGYSAEELQRMHVWDIDPNVPPEMWGKDGALAKARNHVSAGLRNFRTQHRHRDGHLIPVEINSGHFDYEGQTYAIAICNDITEQLAAEEALLRDIEQRKEMEDLLRKEKAEQAVLIRKLEDAQAQLLQSEKLASLGQLAAGVAHEINNPIGFVRSNLHTLKDYAERLLGLVAAFRAAEGALEAHPALRDAIARAEREADLEFLVGDLPTLIAESIEGADRVRRIVQDLRDFARIDSAEWQRADLHAGLESTINVVWNEIRHKGDLVRDYGDLPPVECIPARLNQVFMNILVNATQAIAERGTITVSTRRCGDAVEIAISDTGAGIPEDIRSRIFDPFFTTKPVGKGTGLGLAVSYGIVKNHGGDITVDSVPGKQTTFRIRLPIDRAPASPPPAA